MGDPTGLGNSGGLDPVLKLLFFGIVLFVLLLVWISKWSPNDGQTFQVVSGVLTGFVGAFLTKIRPQENDKSGPKQ